MPCILTGIALIAFLSGCNKDYFNKQPLDSISDATFWKTEKDATLALTGCYNIGAGWTGENFWMPRGILYLDLMAGLGSEKELIPDHITDGTLTSAYWVIGSYWSNTYNKIARCNNFLVHVDQIPMDENKREIMKAEVRTLRAYEFFNLALYYGDVPMPQKMLTIQEANTISRTPKSEVWAFAENELSKSYPLLPATRPATETGRITKGAALAILGRVLMAEKKWAQAAAAYKLIIDDNNYLIDQNGFKQLFLLAGEDSKEIILASQFQEDLYSHVMLQYLYPETYGGWHQFSPYNELVQTFECKDGKTIDESPLYNANTPYDNRDPRLDYTIMINRRTSFKGVLYISEPGSSSPDRMNKYNWSGYSINKFMDSTFSGNLANYDGNFSIIRYAEVLLSYLEAKMEAGDPIDQALLDATINKVRGRSGVNMPAVTAVVPSALRPIIRRERVAELAFEGLHYFDILRWGTAAAELNRQFTGMKLTNDPANYKDYPVDANGFFIYQKRNFKAGINELWPIPQSERDVNPNLTQNTGY
ncbi:RagB/SusD family nutrient uptake outer membrane protein [Niabella yanshanensis]|uniref:RagB/SusD family nutrient uptake outer membrane protein n=1 Tax=Niabella yanshanensis TaxID=577386 RepID=A0ABZ0WBB2_9BACT|nr:RagB/SusD family nutrient uptake outer membrane protein [Niabella yanshanensis]WQD39371.1 RagB/SusD family nutrient uptake outer membrane protein [Niabella yanshanensis]